jgi:hypothetical protein
LQTLKKATKVFQNQAKKLTFINNLLGQSVLAKTMIYRRSKFVFSKFMRWFFNSEEDNKNWGSETAAATPPPRKDGKLN